MLEIASVTAALRSVLTNGLIRHSGATGLGDVTVTVLPPDRVSVGSEEPNQLNLFMYRVTPHSALKNARGAIADAGVKSRTIAFDLHYLLTAYGAQDYNSEILLGCAVQLLSGTPVLNCDALPATAESPARTRGSAGPRAGLAPAELAREAVDIRITPQFLSSEEMSKLWSSLQARYRPSLAYEVSPVTMSLER